jgi:CRP/FNR family cyclic AMP-dependent transcriptional regulator
MKQADYLPQYKCGQCAWRTKHFFCDLPEESVNAFEALKITQTYRKGSFIFFEGEQADGIFMLCHGRVKLSTYSENGRVLTLRVLTAGELLGLSSVVSDAKFEATAEVIEDCQVNFVLKSDFLHFLLENRSAAFNAIHQLSQNYQSTFVQVRSMALSATVADKLARLFLDWSHSENWAEGSSSNGNMRIRFRMAYTHEEIAAMIGSCRETVTRLLNDFRRKNLIQIDGSDFVIDKRRLELIIGSRARSAKAV